MAAAAKPIQGRRRVSLTDEPLVSASTLFAIWLWVGWMVTLPALLLLVAVPGLLPVPARQALGCTIALATVWPLSETSPAWGHRLGAWIMRRAVEYFALTSIVDDADALAAAPSPAIVALEPHGVLPVGIFALSKYVSVFPPRGKEKRLGLMTTAVFLVPFMRQLYTWCSAGPVDKKSFVKHLKAGTTCGVIPGGVQEVIHMAKGRRARGEAMTAAASDVCLYLQKRKGFIKLALVHGTPVIPTFVFGLDNAFDYWVPDSPTLDALGRKLGMLPMVFWGLWGIPFGPPKPCKLTIAIGAPLLVGAPNPAPTPAQIEALHAEYVRATERLYHKHKAQCGFEGVTLTII